uniref:uncharacterized protein isoform X2 n=1 Tax=Myxine glutinosa TaxID=7769 RepID=UPI00358F5960
MGNRDVTSGEKAAEEMNVNGARMRIEEESNVGDGGDVEEVSQVGSKQNYEDQLKEANKWILEYFMHMAKAVFIKGEQYRFKQLYDLMEEGVNQEKKKEQMANEIFDLLLRSGTVEDGDTEELRNIQKKFCSPSCQFEGWKKQLLQRFLELNLPEHEIHLLKAVRCSLEEPLPITKEANYNKTDESEHFSSDETNDLAKIMKKTPFCSLFDDSQDSSEIFEPPKGLQRSQPPSAEPGMEAPSHKKSDRSTNSGDPTPANVLLKKRNETDHNFAENLVIDGQPKPPSAEPGMEGPSHKSDRLTNSGDSTPANVLMKDRGETDLNVSENLMIDSPPHVRSSLAKKEAAQSEMTSVVAGGESSNSVGVTTKYKSGKLTLAPPVKCDEWTRQMRKWSPGVMKTRFFKAQRKHSILLQKETKYAIGKLQTRLQIIPQLGGKQRKGSGLIRRRSGSEKVCRFMESASGH